MKVAISLPDATFKAAEQVSKQLRMSRSQLYSQAVEAFVKNHRGAGVVETLAAVYGSGSSVVDPVLDELQAEALREEW